MWIEITVVIPVAIPVEIPFLRPLALCQKHGCLALLLRVDAPGASRALQEVLVERRDGPDAPAR